MTTYDVKQFERDPEKAKARARLKDNIATFFPGERSNLTAAFLTGPSLVEFHEVYGPLGFQPSKVYGIEQDPAIFAAVERENDALPPERRINLIRGTDITAYDQTPPLNVVSLDFLQNYGPTVVRSLNRLFDPNSATLDEKTLLAINTQARRENAATQWRLNALCSLGVPYESTELRMFEEFFETQTGKTWEADPTHTKTNTETASTFIGDIMGFEARLEDGKGTTLTSFLPAIRYGMFTEIAVRAAQPLVRTMNREDVLAEFEKADVRAYTQKNLGVTPERVRACYECLRETGKSLRIDDDGTLRDPLDVVMLYPYFGPQLMKKIGLEPIPASQRSAHLRRGSRALQENGFYLNKLVSKSIRHYDSHDYVSASGTPMLTHTVGLEQVVSGETLATSPLLNATHLDQLERLGNLTLRVRTQAAGRKDRSFQTFLRQRFGGTYKPLDVFTLPPATLQGFRVGQEVLNILQEAGQPLNTLVDVFTTHHGILRGLLDAKDVDVTTKDKYTQELLTAIQAAKPPEAVQKKHAPQRVTLSNEDKDAIRDLHRQGNTPKEIYEAFYEDTEEITRPMVGAVCAWNSPRLAAKRKAQ